MRKVRPRAIRQLSHATQLESEGVKTKSPLTCQSSWATTGALIQRCQQLQTAALHYHKA